MVSLIIAASFLRSADVTGTFVTSCPWTMHREVLTGAASTSLIRGLFVQRSEHGLAGP